VWTVAVSSPCVTRISSPRRQTVMLQLWSRNVKLVSPAHKEPGRDADCNEVQGCYKLSERREVNVISKLLQMQTWNKFKTARKLLKLLLATLIKRYQLWVLLPSLSKENCFQNAKDLCRTIRTHLLVPYIPECWAGGGDDVEPSPLLLRPLLA
jgi:hypothetical protein